MRLHNGPAVLHCVMCAVAFFVLKGGLEYGLHDRAERHNRRMSPDKNLFHTNLYFYRVSNAL